MQRAKWDPLAVAIARTCGEWAAHVTRSILRGERTHQILFGPYADGERAVYYRQRDYAAVALPVDGDRRDARDGREVGRDLRLLRDAEAWVQAEGRERWAWVHPRIRWVLGDDSE